MTELDRVLDTVMKSKAELIKNEAPDEDRDEFIASLREQQRKKIIDEIREDYSYTYSYLLACIFIQFPKKCTPFI